MKGTIKFTPRNPTIGWIYEQYQRGSQPFRDFCAVVNCTADFGGEWLAAAVRAGFEDTTVDKLITGQLPNEILEKIANAMRITDK